MWYFTNYWPTHHYFPTILAKNLLYFISKIHTYTHSSISKIHFRLVLFFVSKWRIAIVNCSECIQPFDRSLTFFFCKPLHQTPKLFCQAHIPLKLSSIFSTFQVLWTWPTRMLSLRRVPPVLKNEFKCYISITLLQNV